MAVCWSCDRGLNQQASGATLLDPCPHCGALQPIPAVVDHFHVLGLPRRMGQDRKDLDRAFRQRSKTVHPDRFRDRSALERKLALEHTTRVNEAYRVLKDPRRRAEYMLSLHGIDLGTEEQRTQDPELLMAMMERTEAIDAADTPQTLEQQAAALKAESKAHLARAEAFFDRSEGSLDQVRTGLEHNRYLVRLLERVEGRLENMT